MWSGKLPTGIDRTCLAYLRQYRSRALAVVQRGGFTRVLNAARSAALFDLLLEPDRPSRAALIRVGLPALLSRQPPEISGRFILILDIRA